MKPITLNEEYTEALRKAAIEEIKKQLDPAELIKSLDVCLKKLKMSDGQFSFKKDFKFEHKFDTKADSKQRATLSITPEAFAKMALILATNDKEVAWHGVTERVSETEFVIRDVLIYPQTVSSVTVDTDDEEYAKWLIQIGEDNFNNLHAQMHSHVNMSVSPSGVDMGHREKIVSQLGHEDYYIFMIWNKSMNWSAAIYDMASNIMYETSDIDVVVEFENGMTAGDILLDLKEKVVTAKPAASTYAGTPSTTGKKNWWEEQKSKESTKGVSGAGNGLDDFRDYYANRGYFGGYGGYGGYYD